MSSTISHRSQSSGKPRLGRSGHRRRIVIGSLAILTMVGLLLFGREILALWGRHMAARRIKVGAIGQAEQWLKWSARLDPHDGNTDLMQASCFRQLGQMGLWERALQSARHKGAAATRVRQEVTLARFRTGQFNEAAETQLGALIESGVSAHEGAAALVRGYLAREQPQKAKVVLEAWAADFPQEAHVAYLYGVYHRSQSQLAQAEADFKSALARQPHHELARLALGELFEDQDRLDEAFMHYAELATRSPEREIAKVALARVLRKRLLIDRARAVLEPLASSSKTAPPVAAEMGQIELASGDYDEAERWFERAGLDPAEDSDVLYTLATTFALEGKTVRVERLFARLDAMSHRSVRRFDLAVRLAVDLNDKEAADELQLLASQSAVPLADRSTSGPRQEDGQDTSAASGSELYALHCSACHGPDGDGNGRAARHLFPKPRDLRTPFRLVSTLNTVPTPDDLEAVIRRGMPGTSMRSFENLPKDQRMLLAQEVLRRRREGIRDQFIDLLKSEGEEVDESEVREVVELSTTPGAVLPVPRIGPADAQSVEKGKETYFQQGCDHCHGNDGRGAAELTLVDDKGRPARPRDLVHEPFRGGEEPESIYLRLALGMPGSPHPASSTLTEDALIELVHYCGTLSRQPKRVLTNYQQDLLATSRAYLSAFGQSSGK